MPFLINEDEALKQLLGGITVSDQNDNARPVKVYFRLPEPEERQITYPFITIDLIDIDEETDRSHRGIVAPEYSVEGYSDPAAGFGAYQGEFPIPVSLIYQLTTFTRSAWHDRLLSAAMLGNKIPFRYGSLDVPADETVRRLDLLEWQSVDSLDRDNKRVFRKAYTIAVSSELLPEAMTSVQTVDTVDTAVFHQLEPFIVEPADP